VTDQNPPAWPFSQQLPLTPKLKTITNPEIIRYLFDRLHGVFSFYVWDFNDNGKKYSVALLEVPGWLQQKCLKSGEP
jgi:hypothetical protein